jgi:hypothetical protein
MSGRELQRIEVLSEVLARRRTEISAAALLLSDACSCAFWVTSCFLHTSQRQMSLDPSQELLYLNRLADIVDCACCKCFNLVSVG